MTAIQTPVEILKVDEAQGIVYGFAIVCKNVVDGQAVDYYDTQDDNIPESVMVEAAAKFAQGARLGKAQHGRTEEFGQARTGDVIFVFPLTQEIAKGLGVETKKYGLLIGYKVTDKALLEEVKKGVYTGFSLGGSATREEVAA